MPLLDDIKLTLRLTTDELDSEVQMLIGSALHDLERVGVNPALLELDEEGNIANANVKTAIACYCKNLFGYDNSEAYRFDAAYNRIVVDLLNSAENIAAIAVEESAKEQEEPAGEGD